MTLQLSENEYWQIRDVAQSEGIQDVLNILDVEGREISKELDIFRVRSFSAYLLETGAAEIHGLDEIEPVYNRTSKILFPKSSE